MEELLDCLIRNISCDLAAPYLGAASRFCLRLCLCEPNAHAGLRGLDTFSHYVGVYNGLRGIGLMSKFIHDFAADLTAALPPSPAACDRKHQCASPGQLCINGSCYDAYAYYHDAYSPAFQRHSGSWHMVLDPSLPTYTES